MGPKAPHTYPGPRWSRRYSRPHYETDYGHRGSGGYIFGALQPHTGEALTHPYTRRTITNFTDFLTLVEEWIDPAVERIYVILDNLKTHRAYDVLLFSLAHPRWEFVFQPIKAAYLNLIEPWWKIHHSLAFAGGRFDSWSEMETASHRATAYWNQHKHPFRWGTRKRHRARQRFGVAIVPKQIELSG